MIKELAINTIFKLKKMPTAVAVSTGTVCERLNV